MDISAARLVLNNCTREELRDHAFGDAELFWFKDGKEIATGYKGNGHDEVYLTPKTRFVGAMARELQSCGTLGHVERNDMTGPDIFVAGAIMPGLTREAVRAEITTCPTHPDMDCTDLG
jgi:hypothetical protein